MPAHSTGSRPERFERRSGDHPPPRRGSPAACTTPAEVQADRVEALEALSAKFGNCHVVLKETRSLAKRMARYT